MSVDYYVILSNTRSQQVASKAKGIYLIDTVTTLEMKISHRLPEDAL